MKTTLKIEETAFFLLAIWAFSLLPYSPWLFLLLLFTPDLSMLGYLLNPRLGALSYNLIHHRALALVLYALGLQSDSSLLMLIGVILFAHSSMDRIFGYGLKFADSFQITHLGRIGKQAT